MAKRGLGRGIEALIPGVGDFRGEEVLELDPREIRGNPYQPRQVFDESKIEEMAASMREHGVIQPLIVRRVGEAYQLVAGERRLRAAILAGLNKVPVVVRDMDERQAMEISLVENLQREDLGPLEEAEAFERLMTEFGLTQEEVAKRVGKSRAEVANTLRILKLEPEVKALLAEGKLSGGHGRALVGLAREEQLRLARAIVSKGMSVRKVEEVISERTRRAKAAGRDSRAVRLREAEEVLSAALGSPVSVTMRGSRGSIQITFFGEEDLERLVDAIQKAFGGGEGPVS